MWNRIKTWWNNVKPEIKIDSDDMISILIFVILTILFVCIFGWSALGYGVTYLVLFLGSFAIDFSSFNKKG